MLSTSSLSDQFVVYLKYSIMHASLRQGQRSRWLVYIHPLPQLSSMLRIWQGQSEDYKAVSTLTSSTDLLSSMCLLDECYKFYEPLRRPWLEVLAL